MHERKGTPSVSPRFGTQEEFLRAIRRGEALALREMFEIYAPLLRDRGRRLRCTPELLEETVTLVLDDTALEMISGEASPRMLAGYLVSRLRNTINYSRRAAVRRAEVHEQASTEIAGTTQRIVASCHSQDGMKRLTPPDVDEAPPSSALLGLAKHSAQELSPLDQLLALGVSERVPTRELAEQAGITYENARVRIHRLRERLMRLARQYAATLTDDQRTEIDRFLRRTTVEPVRSEDRQRRNS